MDKEDWEGESEWPSARWKLLGCPFSEEERLDIERIERGIEREKRCRDEFGSEISYYWRPEDLQSDDARDTWLQTLSTVIFIPSEEDVHTSLRVKKTSLFQAFTAETQEDSQPCSEEGSSIDRVSLRSNSEANVTLGSSEVKKEGCIPLVIPVVSISKPTPEHSEVRVIRPESPEVRATPESAEVKVQGVEPRVRTGPCLRRTSSETKEESIAHKKQRLTSKVHFAGIKQEDSAGSAATPGETVQNSQQPSTARDTDQVAAKRSGDSKKVDEVDLGFECNSKASKTGPSGASHRTVFSQKTEPAKEGPSGRHRHTPDTISQAVPTTSADTNDRVVSQRPGLLKEGPSVTNRQASDTTTKAQAVHSSSTGLKGTVCSWQTKEVSSDTNRQTGVASSQAQTVPSSSSGLKSSIFSPRSRQAKEVSSETNRQTGISSSQAQTVPIRSSGLKSSIFSLRPRQATEVSSETNRPTPVTSNQAQAVPSSLSGLKSTIFSPRSRQAKEVSSDTKRQTPVTSRQVQAVPSSSSDRKDIVFPHRAEQAKKLPPGSSKYAPLGTSGLAQVVPSTSTDWKDKKGAVHSLHRRPVHIADLKPTFKEKPCPGTSKLVIEKTSSASGESHWLHRKTTTQFNDLQQNLERILQDQPSTSQPIFASTSASTDKFPKLKPVVHKTFEPAEEKGRSQRIASGADNLLAKKLVASHDNSSANSNGHAVPERGAALEERQPDRHGFSLRGLISRILPTRHLRRVEQFDRQFSTADRLADTDIDAPEECRHSANVFKVALSADSVSGSSYSVSSCATTYRPLAGNGTANTPERRRSAFLRLLKIQSDPNSAARRTFWTRYSSGIRFSTLSPLPPPLPFRRNVPDSSSNSAAMSSTEKREKEREKREQKKEKLEREKEEKKQKDREKKEREKREREERELRDRAERERREREREERRNTLTQTSDVEEDSSVDFADQHGFSWRILHTLLHLVFICLLLITIVSLGLGVSHLFANSAREVVTYFQKGMAQASYKDLALALIGFMFFLFVLALTFLSSIMLIPALWVSLIEIVICPWSVLSEYFLP